MFSEFSSLSHLFTLAGYFQALLQYREQCAELRLAFLRYRVGSCPCHPYLQNGELCPHDSAHVAEDLGPQGPVHVAEDAQLVEGSR